MMVSMSLLRTKKAIKKTSPKMMVKKVMKAVKKNAKL